MRMPDRDGLIARVRRVRRLVAGADRTDGHTDGAEAVRLQALETRVMHLERLVEGLQDSVHRESERHEKLIADLHAQVQPGALGPALAEHARGRRL